MAAPPLTAGMRVVILHGPDRYLIGAHTAGLVEALEKEHGEIERFTYDGAVTDPAVVLDELRSYGLLQSHKLVVLDNADKFLVVKDDEAAAPSPAPRRRPRGGPPAPKTARQLLEKYASNPVDSATLLLRSETWRPGKLDAAVKKIGAVIKCDTPTPASAASFCVRRCEKEHGAAITPEAAALLVERIGPILARLDAELGKLASFVGEGGTIGPDEIRAMVGLSREEKAWAIQSALLSGSAGSAVTKMRELAQISQQPDALLTWAMLDLLRKLHAGAQLVRQGAPGAAIARDLKLWGPERDLVVDAVRRIDPERFAQLLQTVIEADLRTKRGFGKAPRTLEALAVLIADTMKRA